MSCRNIDCRAKEMVIVEYIGWSTTNATTSEVERKKKREENHFPFVADKLLQTIM